MFAKTSILIRGGPHEEVNLGFGDLVSARRCCRRGGQHQHQRRKRSTSVKGIGDKRAQEIIDYRKKNGDFKSVDDLEKVPGIGPGTMKQIRSKVSVTGTTTVDKPAEKAKAVEQTKAKAPDPAKSKGAETKKTDASKSDAMKAENK